MPAFNDQKGRAIPEGSIVAVTGASGYIGSHVVKVLLEHKYTVRACVRDAENKEKTAHLNAMAEKASGKLELFSADLFKAGSYDKAFDGADAVVHCAAIVANKNSVKGDAYKAIVDPSVAGTVTVTESIHKSKSIKRVVHTSSVAAIQTYDKPSTHVFSEEDWNTWSSTTNEDYYGLGKTLAEEKAILSSHGKDYDLVVINPCVVVGTCLTKKHTKASPVFIRQLLYGNAMADTPMTFVDVEDVAMAHLEALRRPEAGNNRFVIAGDDETSFFRFPALADKMQKMYPDLKVDANLYGGVMFNLAWTFTMTAFEKAVIQTDVHFTNEKSKKVLGLKYASFDDTLKRTVDSMVDTGFVKPRKKQP
uniref:NAD-dependent epimerase/dehydratase domain-containing protein n=1 Tax=Lotharella globosa TaxID=91324 RepID=A0A7S3Z7T0_9EUKA